MSIAPAWRLRSARWAGRSGYESAEATEEVLTMAKDHGSSVKNDKQYEGLRKKGMSKGRAAAISNANEGSGNQASKKGGKNSGGGGSGRSQSSKASGSGSGGDPRPKQGRRPHGGGEDP